MAAGKPALLLVDDEERILRSLAMLFRAQYRVHSTVNPQEALELVAREPVHVVISDQKMPLMRGADLLREVKERSPKTMRILLTGYSELDAVMASVNEGEIFRYVSKPWDAAELRSTVDQAAQIASALFEMPPAESAPAAAARAVTAADMVPAAPSSAEGILVIEDDAEVFHAVQGLVGPSQPVHWARSLDEAFALLERHPVGVIVSELAVRGESLATALKLLKAQYPEVVTVVLTPFEDTAVLVNLINQGQVYRLLPKPMRRGPLGMNIASALRQHRLLQASPQLRRRHMVERIKQAEETSMAQRVLGFLGRLRQRTI
ncbi:MAG: response regulator [Nevskia sp.]|nr:response regulator [Nevskia sp.]